MLIVFDEFNVSFDEVGEVVLVEVIVVMCWYGSSLVLVIYKLVVLVLIDKLLLLYGGCL